MTMNSKWVRLVDLSVDLPRSLILLAYYPPVGTERLAV